MQFRCRRMALIKSNSALALSIRSARIRSGASCPEAQYDAKATYWFFSVSALARIDWWSAILVLPVRENGPAADR